MSPLDVPVALALLALALAVTAAHARRARLARRRRPAPPLAPSPVLRCSFLTCPTPATWRVRDFDLCQAHAEDVLTRKATA